MAIPIPSHHSLVIPSLREVKTWRPDASELAFLKCVAGHPPLQRGVGGVTQKKRKLASVKPPCFDFSEWRDDKRMTGWYRDGHFCDGMTLEWRDGAEKNRKGIPFENFQRVLSTNQKPGFWALDQSEALILAKFFASTKFEIIQWTVEVIKTY